MKTRSILYFFYTCIVLITLFFSLQYHFVDTNNISTLPIAHQGRIRPVTAYAQLWLYDLYHHQSIRRGQKADFSSSSPIDLLLTLHFWGHTPLDKAPLFWIDSSSKHLSYSELLKNPIYQTESQLSSHMLQFGSLTGTILKQEHEYQERFFQLSRQLINRKEISNLLENEFPLMQRLLSAGSIFKILPGRFPNGEWYSPHSFKIQVYDQTENKLVSIGNFTPFSKKTFESLRTLYLEWEKAILESDVNITLFQRTFLDNLMTAYDQELAGQPYQEAYEKQLIYPSQFQLKLETLYYDYPWLEGIIFLYGAAFVLFLLNCNKTALLSMSFAFVLHTFLLVMRCLILGRAPVSNMFETVFYVPWITVLVSLILQHRSLFIASSFAATTLLILLPAIGIHDGLENVQAVLDSQFWLVIHVLMIVGSYGIFILAGILGHFYLGIYVFNRKETAQRIFLGKLLLQMMYLGTGLLISGTILGGVWAAESWGRFWDWDPKESWAFISSCIYLIWIHAYRFKKISDFGLSVGSIIGLLSISFTWYGVNYLLGTGLHSYGFGKGGESIYFLFIGFELLFLSLVSTVKMNKTALDG